LTVGQSLENDRDVLKILTSYRRVAGKDFGAELDQTIADMKTGNYENALIRFETRIGSPMLSDVIRGLIGVLRGDDQRMYFKMIRICFRPLEQQATKASFFGAGIIRRIKFLFGHRHSPVKNGAGLMKQSGQSDQAYPPRLTDGGLDIPSTQSSNI